MLSLADSFRAPAADVDTKLYSDAEAWPALAAKLSFTVFTLSLGAWHPQPCGQLAQFDAVGYGLDQCE